MSITRWSIAAFITLVFIPLAIAQRETREQPRQTVRGILKSVDAKEGTITVTVGDSRQALEDKTFAISKDAEIAAGDGSGRRAPAIFKAAKLSDLTSGDIVGFTLGADQKTIDSLIAEGPMIQGVLKGVDATNKLLTIAVFDRGTRERTEQPEDKTYSVAAPAEIGIDDGRGSRFSLKEGKLVDLIPGAHITAQLSLDQKSITSVTAAGPTIVGTVKEMDSKKNTITVTSARGREQAEERTVELAKDTVIVIDDGKGNRFSFKEGKPGDVVTGSMVNVRLSLDQKTAATIRAEGPYVAGLLKSVDAAKGTITVATHVARGENPEEKTLTLAKDARIILDGKPTKLADIKIDENGTFINARLSLDQKSVQSLMVIKRRE
jgi:hypothetical protein